MYILLRSVGFWLAGFSCRFRSEISLPIMKELVPHYLQESGKVCFKSCLISLTFHPYSLWSSCAWCMNWYSNVSLGSLFRCSASYFISSSGSSISFPSRLMVYSCSTRARVARQCSRLKSSLFEYSKLFCFLWKSFYTLFHEDYFGYDEESTASRYSQKIKEVKSPIGTWYFTWSIQSPTLIGKYI